jgi:hypothetical protein
MDTIRGQHLGQVGTSSHPYPIYMGICMNMAEFEAYVGQLNSPRGSPRQHDRLASFPRNFANQLMTPNLKFQKAGSI